MRARAGISDKIQPILDGDEYAKTDFYNEFQNYLANVLWAFATRRLNIRQLADDEAEELVASSVVEALAYAIANIHTYDEDKADIRTWLVAIAWPRLQRSVQRAIERRRRELSINLEAELIADPVAGPEKQALHREFRDRIFDTLRSLKPRHSYALYLIHYFGLSLREVTDRLDLPSEEAASSLVRRARLAFRRKWGGRA